MRLQAETASPRCQRQNGLEGISEQLAGSLRGGQLGASCKDLAYSSRRWACYLLEYTKNRVHGLCSETVVLPATLSTGTC